MTVLNSTTAYQLYFEPPDQCTAIQAAKERNFFWSIRLRNGTYKCTYDDRLTDVDERVFRWLPSASPLDVLEVAASSGVSALAWSRALTRAGIQHRMTLGDIQFQCSLVSLSHRLRVLLDASGYPLQFDFFGRAVPNPPRRRHVWARPVLSLLAAIARRYAREHIASESSQTKDSLPSRFVRVDPVELVSPRVLAQSELRVVEDNLLEDRAASVSYHVIRAANILNRDYFEEKDLRRIVINVRRRLRVGGLLIVCSSEGDSNVQNGKFAEPQTAVNHGTLFLKQQENHFAIVDRIGKGSAIESLVMETNGEAIFNSMPGGI